ncbi:MAG TPA: hypothetical protein VN808_02120, partial [Stellaceae bacterium]|nr:hypothetical protein [Stellaceae bacterium]
AHSEIRDGNWWNAQSRSFRTAWVIGFLDGKSATDEELRLLLSLGAMSKDMPPCSADCYAKMMEYGRNLSAAIDDFEKGYLGLSAGQIADGISALYADYRNTHIKVTDVEAVAVAQIRGGDLQQLQARIEYLRKNTK